MLLALSFARAPAQADASTDDTRARAHFIAGESHFAAGRWSDAVREFTLAYELSQRQEMLINRSRAYERNGQLEEARDDLVLLLQRYPETRYRVEAEARMERMQRAIAARPPPTSAPGARPQKEPATELPAVTATPRVTAAPTAPAKPVAPAPAPVARAKRPAWPAIALGSGALALGVVALGTGLKAHGIHGDLDKACGEGGCPPERAGDIDRGDRLAKVSTGLTFGAIALLGGAIGAFVYQVRKPAQRVDLSVDASPQRAAARLQVRF